MANITADQRRFLFKTIEGNFDVLSFQGEEALSSPFEYHIKLLASDTAVNPIDLIRKRGRLTFLTAAGEERHINGVIGRASILESGLSHAVYLVELHPFFWLLGMRFQSRIFQEKNIPDIISDVLREAGFSSSDFRMDLNGSNPARKYCVQYRETDLNFVERLAAEVGIFYFFIQEADREIMVFGNDAAVHPDCAPQSRVSFHFQTGSLKTADEVLTHCSLDARLYSGKIVLSDYNYERPDVQLQSINASRDYQELEIYSHPGGFDTRNMGDTVVRNRKEAAAVEGKAIHGQGTYRCFSAGHKVQVEDHTNDTINGLYVVVTAKHRAEQPQSVSQVQLEKDVLGYNVQFTAIPAEIPFRPRPMEKPFAAVQSAEVIGPEGEQVYMDDLGRVKIRFHWDRQCRNKQDCTCWIRVSDGYAGTSHGIHFPPLIGDEVLVDFIHGDPDRPVITGRVYNGRNTPPVGPDQVVRNVIYTEYGHRFLLDDKNALISLSTGGAEKLVMMDNAKEDGNLIRLVTTDGHTIDLAKGNNLKGIQLVTEAAHTILMEDEPAPGITIKDMNEELIVSLDCNAQTISVVNKTSKAVNVECEAGTIKLLAKNIKVTGSAGVEVDSDSHISLKAPKIEIKGDQTVSINAGQELKAESGMNTTLKGGMVTKVEGGAMTEIKGGIVKIN